MIHQSAWVSVGSAQCQVTLTFQIPKDCHHFLFYYLQLSPEEV